VLVRSPAAASLADEPRDMAEASSAVGVEQVEVV
jgi:hypothetical protein